MIKKFNDYKINEELHPGENLIKHHLEDLSDYDMDRYYKFIEEYNDIVLTYKLRVSNYHGDVAIYDVEDKDNYEKILIVNEQKDGVLYAQ